MRSLFAALLGAAALVVAGCGSSHAATSFDASSLAPKGAGAFVVVDTDQASAQWKNAEALLAKIPGGEKSLDDALSQLGGAKGLDFKKDVAPAFGKQLVVVVPAGAKDPVLLVKPDDSKKLEALLAKDTKPHVMADVDGWTAVTATQEEVDAYKAALAQGSLAGDDGFTKAVDGLPADALVRGYANGTGLPAALGAATRAGSSLTGGITVPAAGTAVEQLGTVGFALSFESNSVRIDGSVAAKNAAVPVSFTPTLLDRVPADALVALSFDGAGQGQKAIDQALAQSGAPLAGLQKQLGVKLQDLAAALDGEGVLYVRAGAPIPEITLAVEPKDAERAKATFAALVAKLGSSGGSGLSIPGFQLTTAAANGVVFVSTAKDAATSLGPGGSKLTSTARFKQAAQEIGFDGKTSGLGYVDVHALGPLLRTALGALGGSNSSSTTSGLEGLSAFSTAIFGATGDGARTRFAAVVNVG